MDEWKVVLAAMADVKRDAPLQLMQRVMTLDMALKALGAAWNRRAGWPPFDGEHWVIMLPSEY